MRRAILLTMALFAAVAAAAGAQENVVPANGYVPDAVTAIAIARAVLVPIYGQRRIDAEEPLTARRDGDTWEVEGDPHCPADGRCDTKTVYVKLSAEDGQILFVTSE